MTSPDAPSPTEIERVPLKVVPLYVQPLEEEPDAPEVVIEEEPRTPTALLGILAAVLALATIGMHVAAIVVATAGDFPTGTLLGYAAIALSAVTVVVGVIAAILGRGRAWGIVAAVVAVLANPFVLLMLLRVLSGLQT